MDNSLVYKKAIEIWGEPLQLNILIEECSELIKAICKLKRASKEQEPERIASVIEELADVEVMLEQMRYIFDYPKVEQIKIEKINKLKKMLSLEN